MFKDSKLARPQTVHNRLATYSGCNQVCALWPCLRGSRHPMHREAIEASCTAT